MASNVYEDLGPIYDVTQESPAARRPNCKCSRMIKNLDAFGHKVEMNFDEKGATHQTLCGGAMSCLFFVFFLAYFAWHLVLMSQGHIEILTTT